MFATQRQTIDRVSARSWNLCPKGDGQLKNNTAGINYLGQKRFTNWNGRFVVYMQPLVPFLMLSGKRPR